MDNVAAIFNRSKANLYKKQLEAANKRMEQLEGEVNAFWQCDLKEGATLTEVIMCRWGRKRLEEMKKINNNTKEV